MGTARVFGDEIDTDLLAPAAYLRRPTEEGARHCLEAIDPDFARTVRPGDVFVAGESLGIGSSREQAPEYLKALGIRCILAKSYARIFYRNALNLGLPALVCPQADRIRPGDGIEVDPVAGIARNVTTGEDLPCEPIPEHLMEMIEDGGLIPHLKRRVANDGRTGERGS